MAGRPADLRLAGSIRPQGRALAVGGGYRIEGRWDFASGINHARWLLCPCVDVGRRQAGAHPARARRGRGRSWCRPRAPTILDTWRVLGLRGTGSHDFTVADVFVPESHSASPTARRRPRRWPLYDPRLFLTWVWTATVANAMGIARGALDAFVELAATKATTTSTTLLRDRPLVQARAAEAEAILSGARAYRLHGRRRSVGARARGRDRTRRRRSSRRGSPSRTACTRRRAPVDLDLPCRGHQCHLREEPARAPFPRHPRGRAARRGAPRAHGVGGQGADGPAPHRSVLVARRASNADNSQE